MQKPKASGEALNEPSEPKFSQETTRYVAEQSNQAMLDDQRDYEEEQMRRNTAYSWPDNDEPDMNDPPNSFGNEPPPGGDNNHADPYSADGTQSTSGFTTGSPGYRDPSSATDHGSGYRDGTGGTGGDPGTAGTDDGYSYHDPYDSADGPEARNDGFRPTGDTPNSRRDPSTRDVRPSVDARDADGTSVRNSAGVGGERSGAGTGFAENSWDRWSGDQAGFSDSSISFPTSGKSSSVRAISGATKMSLKRFGSEAAVYAMSSTQNTHMGEGTRMTYETAGRYILIPGAKSALRMPFKAAAYGMRASEAQFLRSFRYSSPNMMSMPQTFLDRLETVLKAVYGKDYDPSMLQDGSFLPENARDLRKMRQELEKMLRKEGLNTDVRSLKKLIKSGKIDKSIEDLATLYISLNRMEKYTMYYRINWKKALKNQSRRGVTTIRALANKGKNNDIYMYDGALFAASLSRRSIKIVKKFSKKAKKTLSSTTKVVKNTVTASAKATKAAKTAAQAGGKMAVKTSSRAINLSARAGMHLMSASERAAAGITRKAAAFSAKTSSKAAAKTVTAASKVVAKGISTMATVISFAANVLSGLVAAAGAALIPIAVVLVVVLVLIAFLGREKNDSYDMEITDASQLAVQQYIDILVDCHEDFREELQSLYSDTTYESISVDFKKEKNDEFYEIYNNEEGDVEADNNIKECICLMSALFDFDMETSTTESQDLMKNFDKEHLSAFLKSQGMTKDDYDGTYQRLIRTYLIGLFNGSHELDQQVEITYCDGCVATETVNESGETEVSYYCPGHRKLHVTVTTYYFDKLFDCAIKKEPPSLDDLYLVGNNTVETIWFALIDKGFTEQAAAGVIGNLMWESGGGPNDVNLHAVESTGEGIGMVQWSFGRKTNFLNFLASKGLSWPNDDVGVQIEFMLQELNGGQWMWTPNGAEYGADCNVSFSTFKSCKDVAKATKYFCANYERCHYRDSHLDTRIQYAQNVYNTYHGKSPSSGDAIPAGAKFESIGDYWITFYCPCYECSEGYGRQTALPGVYCRANHTCAADTSVLPFGTQVLINGKLYTVEDVGGGVNGKHIDIFVDTHAETLANGSYHTQVYRLVK